MDKLVILSKIESLKRCVDRIKEKSPNSLEELVSDIDSQDVIVLNLERAVQVCVDIAAMIIADEDVKTPMSMVESFELIRQLGVIDKVLTNKMQKCVGFRNVAVHQYQSIEWEIVFSIVKKDLSDFQHYAKQILDWLNSKDSP